LLKAPTPARRAGLSSRLGLGRGGLRLAPDDLLAPVLGVSLGSVTPLALAHPGAGDVVLMLDEKLRRQARVWVHPMVNTASVALDPAGLETFLGSLGREPLYVDLEATPVVDKEHAPDLKHVADAATPMVAAGNDAAGAGAGAAAAAAAAAPAADPSAAKADKKKGGKAAAAAAKPAAAAQPRRHDINAVTDRLVEMAAQRLMGAGGAAAADANAVRRLTADVAMELNALKNAAYASGFKSAQGAMAASLTARTL